MYAFSKRLCLVSLKRRQIGCSALLTPEFFLLSFDEKMKTKPYCSTIIFFLQLNLSHAAAILFFCMVFAAALLIWAVGWSLHYSLAGQTTSLVLFGVFSGFFPVPIRTLNVTTSAGISTERENKQWLQQQGCEKAGVRSLTSSAMMEQGPGFVNQELTAALGCHNHTRPVNPLVLLSMCYCFIQFKC